MINGMYNTDAIERFGEENLIRVQKKLLNMAKCVTTILDNNGVKYMITYGTLLGAVRHKGFIPWDDDFDIFIFEEDYEKALLCLRKELPSDMLVHDEMVDSIYWPYWSRVRDRNSEVFLENSYTDDRFYTYRGLSLDMYKLKKCKKGEEELCLYKENRLHFDKKREKGLISEEKYYKKIEEIDYQIHKTSEILTIVDKNAYYFVVYRTKIDEDSIFPLQKYKFEDAEFWGPRDADSILRNIYGDYLQMPDVENRKPHASYVKFFD